MQELLRAGIFHTPRNPFRHEHALEFYADGGLLVRDGRIAACGDWREVRALWPEIPWLDLRGGFLLPGFVDTHVHYPQMRALGGLGLSLLNWLDEVALPEEVRMSDEAYAADTAQRFVRALAASGTTAALVFGSHFRPATAAMFRAGASAGLRIVGGLVVSDRCLRAELHHTPAEAHRDSTELIREFHGRNRALYAVTPRFAVSTSEAMLEVCQSLLGEHQGLRFTTHINENEVEIAQVKHLFPWAQDYLGVYDRYGLTRPGAVLAHNLHATDSELERFAATGAAVSHCPCSNALLGSGFFPLRRHIAKGVKVSLGTDVGGGSGFGLLKEALQAYSLQRLAPDGMLLDAAKMLYLATLAGAEALLLDADTGDFTEGKRADFVYLKASEKSLLEGVLVRAETPDRILSAIFTLAGPECIRQVRVDGAIVYET